MKKTWRSVKTIKFRDLGSVLIPVEFEDIRDKERVKREGPWSFDMHLVLVKDFDKTISSSDSFDQSSILGKNS